MRVEAAGHLNRAIMITAAVAMTAACSASVQKKEWKAIVPVVALLHQHRVVAAQVLRQARAKNETRPVVVIAAAGPAAAVKKELEKLPGNKDDLLN